MPTEYKIESVCGQDLGLCRDHELCGGCVYQGVPYEEQLRINIERIGLSRKPGDTDYSVEKRAILHTRRHLAATPVFKGIPNFRQTRIQMLRAETTDELIRILEDCRAMLNHSHDSTP